MADQVDFHSYARSIRKHRVPIVIASLTIGFLTWIYVNSVTPLYEAKATILFDDQTANLVNIEEFYNADDSNRDSIETEYELLQSRALATRVIEELGLWYDPEFSPVAAQSVADAHAARDAGTAAESSWWQALTRRIPGLSSESVPVLQDADPATVDALLDIDARDAVIDAFLSRITIEPVRNTRLAGIAFSSADPAQAARTANALGEAYIAARLDARLEVSEQASAWLDERLEQLRAVLDASEDKLTAFKRENGLVDVNGSVGRLNEQELLLMTEELAEARSRLSSAADLQAEIRTVGDDQERLQALREVQDDGVVQRLKIEQGQAQRNLDELRNRYGDRHPRVVDARSQLATLDATLGGATSRVVASLRNEYQLLQQRVAAIRAQLAEGKREIQDLGDKRFELDSLEREVDTNRNLFDTYFNRMSEARSTSGLESAGAKMTDRATLPKRPYWPNVGLMTALAGLSALVLSMLLALIYEQLDGSVTSTEDVTGKLQQKLLGILPLVKLSKTRSGRDSPLIPTAAANDRRFAEAVNTVRTAIALGEVGGGKVVLITSSVPGEGKSTTSLNLAHSFSKLERVLLIDADLRRPTLGVALGLPRERPGLSNLITRTANPDECFEVGVLGGSIDLLPAGPLPAQPQELLASPRFEDILEQLAAHYDRIVIDCAPAQAVADALILCRLADSVVYVVKSHDTPIALAQRGLERLIESGARVAGVLMTQVDVEKLASFSGDYAYQGYYDYYGYSSDKRGAKGATYSPQLDLTSAELQLLRNDRTRYDLELGSSGGGGATYGSAARASRRAPLAATRNRFEDELDQVADRDRPSSANDRLDII